jgi:hypothetical protein
MPLGRHQCQTCGTQSVYLIHWLCRTALKWNPSLKLMQCLLTFHHDALQCFCLLDTITKICLSQRSSTFTGDWQWNRRSYVLRVVQITLEFRRFGSLYVYLFCVRTKGLTVFYVQHISCGDVLKYHITSYFTYLKAFEKLTKATVSFVTSVYPSVGLSVRSSACLRGTSRISPDGFS